MKYLRVRDDNDLGKVAIVNCNPGQVSAEFTGSTLSFLVEDSKDRKLLYEKIYLLRAGGILSVFRNQLTKWFLDKTNAEYLLFIDSDIEYTKDDVYKLVDQCSYSKPVVTGCYPIAADEGHVVCVYSLVQIKNEISMAPWKHLPPKLPQQTTLSADGCGAGFLLIHRSLLVQMQRLYGPVWFDLFNIGKVPFGEDLSFCYRVRQMGFPIHVHPDVRVGHLKTSKLWVSPPQDEEIANGNEHGRQPDANLQSDKPGQ